MLICEQEFSQEIIDRIHETVKDEPLISRRELSRRVCTWLCWKGTDGRLKEMSCRAALSRLVLLGRLTLPERSVPEELSRPRKAPAPEMFGITEGFSGKLSGLGKIDLVLVGDKQSRKGRIWRWMMDSQHYLRSGPLCGAQMRYLIRSSVCGYIGGLSFSSAAWRVGARDAWIGWSESVRRANLSRVVCNSRFLILPQVQVPHLASQVLSRCLRRMPEDWEKRYGERPLLLETFVERDRFPGTCYRAANWEKVGSTQGRGRQDRKHAARLPVKDIYVYPLREDFRESLKPAPEELPLRMSCQEPADWAEEEFGGAELGDDRLNRRLMDLARDFYARPQANIPEACGSRAKTKAAYRFFDHANTTMERELKSHYASTVRRIGREGGVVLAVQDSTSLNYNTHPATENLGLIGSRTDGAVGMWVHETMAFNTEGTPLGLLDVQCWVRDPQEFGKKKRRHQLPIEQKESHKWLKGLQAVASAQAQSQGVTLVSVGDREADIYELFAQAASTVDGPQLLIRAKADRRLAEEERLWSALKAQESAGIQVVRMPRRGPRAARDAQLSVRFAPVRLLPPRDKQHLKPVSLWAVWAKEEAPPAGVTPLEWMLLTTMPVTCFEEATEKLRWYALRWGIEVYHRTLKSGCKIETRQLGNASRIESCLAIDMVVAWRIYHLAKLGREVPDMPCTVYFAEEEWKALVAYVTQNPVPPKEPPKLREALRMVAGLGGFLGRRGDGEPGTQTTWLGLQRLDDLTGMWKVMVSDVNPENTPGIQRARYG